MKTIFCIGFLVVGSCKSAHAAHQDFAEIPEKEILARVERRDPDFILEAGTRKMRGLMPYLKKVAAEEMPRTPGNQSKQELRRAEYLNERYIRSSRAARMALAKMGDDNYFNEFLVELSTQNVAVKQDAIRALGYIGNKRAAKRLIKVLDEGGYPQMLGPHELQMPPSYAADIALGQIFPDAAAEFRKAHPEKKSGFRSEWKLWWEKNKQKYDAE